MSLRGQARPFSERPDFSVLGTLRGLNLPKLSGYSAGGTGYFVDSGQADADIDVKADSGALSGKVGMRLARLQVSPAEKDKIDALTAQLSMPLPLALSVLSNDDNEINLSLPLSGDTTAPDFGVAPLINKLLGIALREASIGYLSNLLQPYATVFTVAKLAYDAASKIALDPMPFTEGQVEPAGDALEYIEKLAGLLKSRPGLSIQLCGVATPDEAAHLKGEGGTVVRGGPPNHEPGQSADQTGMEVDDGDMLHALARSRALGVKHILVSEYGIDAGRLFICRPEVDQDDKGVPRVNLSI